MSGSQKGVTSIFGSRPPTLAINYTPHKGQLEVSKALSANFCSINPASIVELICSRGWGKTLYMCCTVLAPYLDSSPNASVMWVAPTYQIAQSPIDDVFKGVDELTNNHWIPEFDYEGNRVWEFVTTRSGPTLRWWNGAKVIFRSADSPESIVSKGFNLIIMDEAALVNEMVFMQQIMGTARKKGIKIFMITSPRGKRHWTYRIFLQGQSASETDYISFQQPWWKNPFFSPILAKLMNSLPDWLKRQEYGAEFIDDGESLFKSLDSVFYGPNIDFESPQQEWSLPVTDISFETPAGKVERKASQRTFIVGLDLAKAIDYSVFTVLDLESGDLVYYKRINKEDYRNILKLAETICATYNHADLIFDATGVGQGLGDMLGNYNVTAHPFVFTNDSKVEIVNSLIMSIEHQQIRLPNIFELKKELSAYTYTLTRTGKISYNAPDGFHDDIVMSLAMANWYRKENSVDNVGVIDSIIDYNSSSEKSKSWYDQMLEDND